MFLKAIGLASVAAVAVAIPAAAHHSFAMFDALKIVQLEGTVKEFQWTNPHAWILLNVKDEQGQTVMWAIEMNGPTGLARQGWPGVAKGGFTAPAYFSSSTSTRRFLCRPSGLSLPPTVFGATGSCSPLPSTCMGGRPPPPFAAIQLRTASARRRESCRL